MSVALAPASGLRRTTGAALALRFAWREIRGGLRGFYVFVACIALGVMAIAGVASVASGLADGLAREGRVILGGDVAFSLSLREASPEERSFIDARGRSSVAATMRPMARTNAALASEASGQRGDSIVRAPDTRPEPGSSARARRGSARIDAELAWRALGARRNLAVAILGSVEHRRRRMAHEEVHTPPAVELERQVPVALRREPEHVQFVLRVPVLRGGRLGVVRQQGTRHVLPEEVLERAHVLVVDPLARIHGHAELARELAEPKRVVPVQA